MIDFVSNDIIKKFNLSVENYNPLEFQGVYGKNNYDFINGLIIKKELLLNILKKL